MKGWTQVCNDSYYLGYEDGYKKGYADAVKELKPQWVPVTERLPEPRIDVWCDSDLGQMPGFYDETTETWYGRDYLELLVNAWMPLPEPYQPEEEGEQGEN